MSSANEVGTGPTCQKLSGVCPAVRSFFRSFWLVELLASGSGSGTGTSILRSLRWPSSKREKKWKAKLSYATLSTTIKINLIEFDLIKGNQIIMKKIRLDILWRKTTFDGRWPLTEDDLWWKTTFDGRQSLTEEDLWWKMTFDGKRPSIGGMVNYLKKCLWLITLTATAQLTSNWKSYQLSKPEIDLTWWKKCMWHNTYAHVQKRRHF